MDYQRLRLEYDANFFTQIQVLMKIRKQKFTQSEMAKFCNCSLKTIQNFESYECQDGFIMFVYNKILLK
jgi:hypothetical protein